MSNDRSTLDMVAKIEALQDFIKVSSADNEISERAANEMLRITNEAIEIGINNR